MSATKERLPLAEAKALANEVIEILAPFCESSAREICERPRQRSRLFRLPHPRPIKELRLGQPNRQLRRCKRLRPDVPVLPPQVRQSQKEVSPNV